MKVAPSIPGGDTCTREYASRQLGLHGHGVARVVDQGVGRYESSYKLTVESAARARARCHPSNGLSKLLTGLRDGAGADPPQRAPSHLPPPRLEPLAVDLLAFRSCNIDCRRHQPDEASRRRRENPPERRSANDNPNNATGSRAWTRSSKGYSHRLSTQPAILRHPERLF